MLKIWPVHAPNMSLTLRLTGRGVSPQMRLEPPDVVNGIDMGDVVVGECSKKKITV